MSDPDPVMDLLLRWEELQQEGRPTSAEELCRDCPEHLPALRRCIGAVCAVGRLVGDTHDEGATVTGQPPRPWPVVEGYEILGELGRGGMGVVYQARQVALNRVVALKMLLAGAHAGEYDLVRFRREAETLAQMQHPGIVQIHELGSAGGHLYLALEYVEGGSLADRLRKGMPTAEKAARWVAVAARAVAAAHAKGVVHRDLKPGNVLLAADGQPKVSDFGLAKRVEATTAHTPTGAVLGTPAYMAPEQATGNRQVGPAADVYGLGAILYEVLAGQPPFRAANLLDLLPLVVSAEPVRPSRIRAGVPRALERICLKCLEKRPERRYRSAAALADDLERWLRKEPVRLGEERWFRRLGWAVERQRQKVAFAAALLLALGGGFLLLNSPRDERPAAQPAKGPEDPDRALREINLELANGKAVTLIGAKGLPRWERWLVNGGSIGRLGPDGTFAVSSVSDGLLELVRDPQATSYRFRADVRHDHNPDRGRIGIFFGFRYNPKVAGNAIGSYCDLNFSDRGDTARTKYTPNGKPLSALQLNFRHLRIQPGQAFVGRLGLRSMSFSPSLPVGVPSLWRTLIVEVTPERVRAYWGAGPNVPLQRAAELPTAELSAKVNELPGLWPTTPGLPHNYAPHGALGLYVLNSNAAFRHVIIEPLSEK